ncbi:MAG: hypothetical protein KF799_00920 [Bdellovibrionales bacterium]|nr:hypothetical protein [Bdellovibrionales bacterium]
MQAVPPPPEKHKRSTVLQMMNNAGRQFWGQLAVAILFLLPVVGVYAGHLLYKVMGEIMALPIDAAAAEHVVHELRSVGFLFLSVIILLCLLGIYFIIFLSVRVYGPQVALLRFIEQMKQGNYTPYRNLRKDDQLKEIWQALQELAASLKRRG